MDHDIGRLKAAVRPEDVFGIDPAAAKREYRRLARLVHPDRGGDTAVFLLLESFWRGAERLLALGIYGTGANPIVVRSRRGEYNVERLLAVGEIADVHLASHGDSAIAFKVARKPRDNDLLRGEARTLARLNGSLADRYKWFVPELVESIGVRQSGGIVRQANALTLLDGFYTLRDVTEHYPGGIDARDMAWMWRRLLYVLGAVHETGIVHGAVNPDHVLIHPEKHGLVLIDWCYAVDAGRRVPALDRRWRVLVAPEIPDRKPVGYETDLFMGAQTMLTLLRYVPPPFAAHFRACTSPDQRARIDDAWGLKQIFDELIERLYGRRTFRPFTMNGKEN